MYLYEQKCMYEWFKKIVEFFNFQSFLLGKPNLQVIEISGISHE